MRRLSALLLSVALPALAAAQSLDGAPPFALATPTLGDPLSPLPVLGSPTLSNLQAMPLWGTPDGRVLAMVTFGDSSVASKAQSPQIATAADWKFVDVTNYVTSGLLLNFDRDAAAYAMIGRSAIVGPLYAPSAAVPCAPAASPLALDAACGRAAVLAHAGTLQVGANWNILDDLDLDLSYGLNWLRHDAVPASPLLPGVDLFGAIANPQFPTLLIPGLAGADVQSAGLSALGHWRLGDPATIDFGASLSRLQLYAPNTPPLTSLNEAAVSFGLRHGAFSGVVTGHVLGPADAFTGNNRWAGVDIGFSWRTPWQGELIFGTQNLFSSGAPPSLTDSGNREIDSNQARVPYVQYHQDL